VLVNPRVAEATGAEVAREGCLSIPDFTANVRRATEIVVEGTTADAGPRRIESAGFEARCLLHELDHLDGILFLDRVDSLKTDVFRRKRYK
jgi:peptide deformylase